MNNFKENQKRLARAVWVLAKSGAFKASAGPKTEALMRKAERNMKHFADMKEMNKC